MKRIFSVMLCMLFLFSFVSAIPPFQTGANTQTGLQVWTLPFSALEVGKDFDSHVHVTNISTGKELENTEFNCSLHLYSNTGSHILVADYTDNGEINDEELEIGGGNFTRIGEYGFRIFCYAGDIGGDSSGVIPVNYLGKEVPTGFDGRFILLICFILLALGLAYLQKQINFDKWYQKILNKYNKRNFFRTFIAKLGFFFMNNPYSLFYMIGLFIILLMFDITRVYVLESAYNVMEILVAIYLFGIFFLFIEILGDIHEFFSKIAEDIKKMGWGIDG